MSKLSETQLVQECTTIPEWNREGDAIVRIYQCKDFPAAISFVDQIAVQAEAAWHHPDIDIRWNKVRLLLTTHDEGGLTEKDFSLAREFDRIATAASG